MFGQAFRNRSVQNPCEQADLIRRWRCGRIIMRQGKLVEVQRRWFVGSVSVAQVWWQTRYGRPDDDFCWLDYHTPLGMPSFLTLDYIRSGRKAGYKTFVGACHILDEIARLKNVCAIVAHVSTSAISDRLLQRLGWQRHLQQHSGRHWIKRFYEGYPDSRLASYL